MTNISDMTKAEILDVWKGFVRNMSDQGAVFPFANEIARLARNELLARVEAAEKERDALLNALETLAEHFEYYMGDNECRPLENARAAIAKATEAKP